MLPRVFDTISFPCIKPQLEDDNKDDVDEQDADDSAGDCELTSVLDKDFKEPKTCSALVVVNNLGLVNVSRT